MAPAPLEGRRRDYGIRTGGRTYPLPPPRWVVDWVVARADQIVETAAAVGEVMPKGDALRIAIEEAHKRDWEEEW